MLRIEPHPGRTRLIISGCLTRGSDYLSKESACLLRAVACLPRTDKYNLYRYKSYKRLFFKNSERKKKFMKIKELVRTIEQTQIKDLLPQICIGDTVKVGVLIQEGNKQRVQPYEGTVIAQHRAGLSTTITVRRIFQGIGVERVFTIHSPSIQDIQVVRSAKVRRAKLYYLRNRVGKGTRLKERFGLNKNTQSAN